jgi:iron complex outermembrane receptor protein
MLASTLPRIVSNRSHRAVRADSRIHPSVPMTRSRLCAQRCTYEVFMTSIAKHASKSADRNGAARRRIASSMPLATPLALALSSVLSLLISPLAVAQDAAATAPQEAKAQGDLDTITVTGSNLRGIDLQEAQPVVVLTSDDLKEIGANTVGDALKQVSETGGGTGNFSTANSGALQADSPAGSAAASLRGLGTASTLTLVNGRRVAVSSFANGSENFVDINAIPLAAVDRIEVLTTGASAIYGADAVAGVVNVILRKDFDGLRLGLSYGDSTRGTDESRTNANLVYGFQGERVNAMVVIDAYERNALYDRDRKISSVEPRPSQQGIYPSFNGVTFPGDDFVEAGCPAAQFGVGDFGEYCELNRNAFTATDPESRQIGGYATLSFALNDSLEYFSELAFQHNTARADAAPAPWSNERIALEHPGMPVALRNRLVTAGYPRVRGGRNVIVGFGRFPDARTIEVTTDNVRWLNGLRGNLGRWDWETTVTIARSDSEQKAVAGIYNVARVRAGLLGNLCADGSTTCTPTTGGLWYDPFNGQAANSQQVLDLVRETVPREGSSDLDAWDAKFSGLAGAIGGRDIAWAFGGDVRRERVVDDPSFLATADINGNVPVYGFGSTDVDAERTQWGVYAETNLPIVEGFDLRLAGRYDHDSQFGGDFNPSVGFRWRPNDLFLLRGGWNTSFRAPSLAQVGAGTTLSSGALPCSAGSEFSLSFCNGRTSDDSYLSEIYGNEDLKPEISEAFYLGTVFEFADRATLTVDYWNFDQKDLVDIDDLELFRRAVSDRSLIYNSTALPGQPGFLPRGVVGIATRNGLIGGAIDEVQLQLINIGQQKTDGIDLSFDYRFGETAIGKLKAYVDATWTHSFKRSESCDPNGGDTRRGAESCGSDGQRLVERVGEFRYPEWLVNTGVSWSRGNWGARLWANYIDGYYDDDQRAEVPAGRQVASWTTWNLNVDWDIDDRQSIGLNIKNIADRDPPVSLGSASNVDLYNHNTLGRFVTMSYTFRY